MSPSRSVCIVAGVRGVAVEAPRNRLAEIVDASARSWAPGCSVAALKTSLVSTGRYRTCSVARCCLNSPGANYPRAATSA